MKDSTSYSDLLQLVQLVGIDKEQLDKDIKSLIVQRLAMWMIGHVDPTLNFDERIESVKHYLGQTLDSSGISYSLNHLDNVIQSIVKAQISISMAFQERKDGIQSIDELSANQLLHEQAHRCATCGTPLRSFVRKECPRFDDGLEPVLPEHLDHILPFYWGGNQNNTRLLCSKCNNIKHDWMGVQEDGLVLTANHIRSRNAKMRKKRAAFWTLSQNPFCTICECSSKENILWVFTTNSRAPFMYGNISIACSNHAPPRAKWLHDPKKWEKV
jgi:5-methylcytosine-specific restriction endonuclease McrA